MRVCSKSLGQNTMLPFRPAMSRRRQVIAAPATATRQRQAAVQQQDVQQHSQPQWTAGSSAACLAMAAAAALSVCGPAAAAAAADPIYTVAGGLSDLDPATAHAFETVLRPLFAIGTILYIIRIPMTW